MIVTGYYWCYVADEVHEGDSNKVALKYSSQILWELDYSVGGTSMYEDVS